MNRIRRLRDALQRAILNATNGISSNDQELFEELMAQKQRLLQLFDVGPRNAQEQKEVESGKISIDGKAIALNSDYARLVLFISQHLDCSEKYVASVLHAVMRRNSNLSPVEYIEETITEFYTRRRLLVDSIELLLAAALQGEQASASPTLESLRNYVLSDLLPSKPTTGGQATYGHRLFKAIQQHDTVIAKVEAALKNASSSTIAPSQQSQGALGSDILKGRLDSLSYERRQLAISLIAVAHHGFIEPNQIQDLLNWISEHHVHPLAYYILTTILLCFEPVYPGSRLGIQRQGTATNESLMAYMSKKFAPTQPWKDPGLKAAILLKWTMFVTDARNNDGSLEQRAGFKNEELETQVWNGVQGGAFTYLALTVARVSRKSAKDALLSSLVTRPVTESTEQPEFPSEDAKYLLLSTFENLVRALVIYASSELRKIKQKQEDIILANARTTDRNRTTSRFGTASSQELERTSQQPRHDIAILYSFIGLLYSALPGESALQFWGASMSPECHSSYMQDLESTSPRLPGFLQWAVWSTPAQDLIMLTALYDMITGLAKGSHCSELAYNFLARGTGEVIQGNSLSSSSSTQAISWTSIFGVLESWLTTLSNPKAAPQPQPQGFSFSSSIQNLAQPPPQQTQQVPIGPRDVLFAQSFLRLLATVVAHSTAVRALIASHVGFSAIPRLVSLIPLSIPLELKGALFDTLSAFCEPGAGLPGQEICHAVWALMERAEVINVRGTHGGFSSGRGVEVELDQIEAVHKLYPATIPFLKLLATMIHTTKRLPEKERALGMLPSNTIPQNLGQSYRLPGVGPYTSFVIDNVFINIPNREYNSQTDRWLINDLCLCYVERALASFNLESLASVMEEGPVKIEKLSPFLIHPGFDVATRLLKPSPLQEALLTYLVDGLTGFETGMADDEPFFRNTIIRVLRIVLRLLEVQDIFLDGLLPALSDLNTSPYITQVESRSYFTKFDQALSFDARYAPAIAQYMEYANHPEAVLLAIKILSFLSTSSYFSNLTALIERSPCSERVLASFVNVLSVPIPEDISQTELDASLATGAGAGSIQDDEALDQAIRLAALDFLIQDTSSTRAFPNFGHWLLFGTSQSKVQDPAALHSRRSSIHVLLDLVNTGVPRRKERSQTIPLSICLPPLAERCYRIIYQLAMHPRTSDFVTRYLRTREDFFIRQLSNIPSQAPENVARTLRVVYGDGSGVFTTVDSLSSFLRLRSYIFDLVALELHILTNKNHHKGVGELLEILFGTNTDYEESHGFPAFHEVGQSNMRIVDFFQSLLFDWEDSLAVDPANLQFLGQLNLQAAIRREANGYDLVDRPTLLAMLASEKQALVAQGSVVTTAQNDQLSAETNYILGSCAVENHRRQILFSVAGSFESWRRLLDLALTKCFDRLPHDTRENMLFDLLHVVPAAIRSSAIEEPTAVLLSECTLSLVTKLREDRRYQLILQSTGTHDSESLPAERLNSILQTIVEGVIDSNHSELIRGNLYGSLISFIHLVLTTNDNVVNTEDSNKGIGANLASSVNPYSTVVLGHTGNAPGLELGVLAALKPVLERMVGIVSRDATDGTEVWKTVAFMLLDAVVQLSSLEKPHSVLAALERQGILNNFVAGLRDSDSLLQSVLKPDPDDLNPLYVYESKMSLFIKLGHTRQGAERLLEARLIPALSQCDYLGSLPEHDQAFMDQGSFLPSATQRYHQLFTPALQAINGIVSTLGNRHTTATHQALEFLGRHSPTIAILLKTQADHVSLAVLEEIHLVVTLCASVLPAVPRADLLSSTSGFGVIHAAILSLATRCLGQGKAFERVIPNGDAEIQESNVYAFGHGGVSKFDLKVQRKECLLRKAIISYIGSASEFTEPEINLVLSPATVTPKRDDYGSRFSGTIPTIGDALAALDDLINDFVEVLKQVSDISAELSNKHHINSNDAQEMLRDFEPTLLQALEPEQTRSLICGELNRISVSLKNDAKSTLDSLEMLMLLIWRHLEHYANPINMNVPPSKASVANAMRLLQTADPVTFRNESGIKLAPILQKLAAVDMSPVLSIGKAWQESQGYIEIMSRRLRDTVGLLGDDDHFDMDL